MLEYPNQWTIIIYINMLDIRQQWLDTARYLSQSQMYKQICEILKNVIKINPYINLKQISLFQTSYSRIINKIKQGRRRIQFNLKSKLHKQSNHFRILKEFKEKLGNQMECYLEEFLGIIDERLINNVKSSQEMIFYLKIRGDYNTKLWYISTGQKKNSIQKRAQSSYKSAIEISELELSPTSPTKLILVLKYSQFLYDIKKDYQNSYKILKKIFDQGVQGYQLLSDGQQKKDTASVLQSIRDYLSINHSQDSCDND